MEQSLVANNEVNNRTCYEVTLSLCQCEPTKQPCSSYGGNIDQTVRNDCSTYDCLLCVLGLHYYTLQMASIIELLSAQKQG